MNRRKFLALSSASLAAASASALIGRVSAADLSGRRALSMPPLLDTRQSGRLSLAAQTGTTNFLGNAPTPTAGYNQAYLGPTIVMRNGALATSLENRLGEPITAHWHGLLLPGDHDGGPHLAVLPGERWAAEMTLEQRPTTAWYHSHVHGSTARHVYAGLAGVIHHTDGRDDERGLPSQYGVDDLTLVLQDRRFDAAGRMIYNPDSSDILNGFHGTKMLVNGQADAVAVVPKGIVRLRFVNGSNARFYSLYFNDKRPLHLIGTDGGFLPQPAEVTYLRLAPGERAEVLVDFSESNAVLMSARGLALKILDFAVDGTLRARITRLPGALAEIDPIPDIPMNVRRFTLNMGGSSAGSMPSARGHDSHGGHGNHAAIQMVGAMENGEVGAMMTDFAINGRTHDMRRIDLRLKRSTYERWIVNGGGAGVEHPFHVHGVHFRVANVGGGPVGPEDSGWKDTVAVTGNAEIIVRFDHPAAETAPYMYHCHILEHEDSGMMGQFTVT